MLVATIVPKLTVLSDARNNFYKGDYHAAFLQLYGKDLSKSDEILYEKSRMIVILDRKYESYENYKKMNMPDMGLDSLLVGLQKYEVMKDRADELGIKSILDQTRAKIISALSSDYGLSEAEALEILTYDSVDYTRKINSVVNGTPFVTAKQEAYTYYGLDENSTSPVAPPEDGNNTTSPDQFQDILPEEQDYLDSLNNNQNPDMNTPDDTISDNQADEPIEFNRQNENPDNQNNESDNNVVDGPVTVGPDNATTVIDSENWSSQNN